MSDNLMMIFRVRHKLFGRIGSRFPSHRFLFGTYCKNHRDHKSSKAKILEKEMQKPENFFAASILQRWVELQPWKCQHLKPSIARPKLGSSHGITNYVETSFRFCSNFYCCPMHKLCVEADSKNGQPLMS